MSGREPSLRQRFGDYLLRTGLKSTRQRNLILEVLLQSHPHVTIEQLLCAVRRKNPRVGYVTVYRTLRLLVEAGMVTAREFGDGQARYELSSPAAHHDHIICSQCGLIVEFENREIERLQEKAARRLGFRVVSHKLELYCLCTRQLGMPGGRCPHEERTARGRGQAPAVRVTPGPDRPIVVASRRPHR